MSSCCNYGCRSLGTLRVPFSSGPSKFMPAALLSSSQLRNRRCKSSKPTAPRSATAAARPPTGRPRPRPARRQALHQVGRRCRRRRARSIIMRRAARQWRQRHTDSKQSDRQSGGRAIYVAHNSSSDSDGRRRPQFQRCRRF